MEQIAYVNGSFVPMSEAKVSILDRGFLFADGIYEVAAVLDGKLIALGEVMVTNERMNARFTDTIGIADRLKAMP